MRKKKEASDESVFTDAAPPKRLTPTDIQDKVFRQAFRGYDERDVDEFLDRVTEEMARLFAENKRLREELAQLPTTQVPLPPPGMVPGGGLGIGAADGGPLREITSSFIARERDFLRNLAGLIQGHAESVKDDVRRVRDAASPAPAPPAQPLAPPTEGPGASPPPESAATLSQATSPDPATPGEEAPAATPPEIPVPQAAGSGVVDLEGADLADHGVDPARSRAAAPVPASEGDDETIRELFWGEE